MQVFTMKYILRLLLLLGQSFLSLPGRGLKKMCHVEQLANQGTKSEYNLSE